MEGVSKIGVIPSTFSSFSWRIDDDDDNSTGGGACGYIYDDDNVDDGTAGSGGIDGGGGDPCNGEEDEGNKNAVDGTTKCAMALSLLLSPPPLIVWSSSESFLPEQWSMPLSSSMLCVTWSTKTRWIPLPYTKHTN